MSAADWIAERARIEQAASEGPWEHEGVGEIIQHFSLPEPATIVSTDVYGGSAAGVERDEDADFIADARTALPKALNALESVLALHWGEPYAQGPGYCAECEHQWPCETYTAITEALT